jgi:hypothetical protein
MNYVYEILIHNDISKIHQRTYFKFFVNFEHWLDKSFSERMILKSWERSVQWPWNLLKILQKWSGYNTLDTHDLNHINNQFPKLITLCFVHGGLHNNIIISILGQEFIDSKHENGLSDAAIAALWFRELKKPTNERTVCEYPSWIITNPGFLEERKHKEIAKIDQIEIKRLEAIDKLQLIELDKLALNAQLQQFIENAREDYNSVNFDEVKFGKGKWTKLTNNLNIYKAACKELNNNISPNTKKDCIITLTNILFEKFRNESDALDNEDDV